MEKKSNSSSSPILVTRPSMPSLEELMSELAPVWESRWLTNMGPKHRELEAALEGYLGAPHVSLFANGHLALECALEAMGLSGEVITTPFTFASTVHAIVRAGLTPVFADVRAGDLTLDPESAARLVTPRTRAVVPVHVYGNLCDWRGIQRVADANGLKVVYDAAHAFGVVGADGTPAAALGDASMFSFHATKVFNTVEGGCVAYSDPALGGVLAQWRNFGIEGPEEVAYAGGNAKLDELRCAVGLCNLRHVDAEIARRAQAAARYRERLEGVPGLRLVLPPDGARHNHAYMPALFGDAFGATRDEVAAELERHGIFPRKYFWPLASDYACYRSVYDSRRTPVASDAARRVLCLPMYAGLSKEEVDTVCDVIVGCGR